MNKNSVAGAMIIGLLLLGGCGGGQSMETMDKARMDPPMKTMETSTETMGQKPMMENPASSTTPMSQ